MKLQGLTIIFIVIILPVVLVTSFYISTGLKTIKNQSLYDSGLLTAAHDAIYAFEINVRNNQFSDNPETKRTIIKSSVKMFETSLANACNISAYNVDEIEEYLPAIVYGMYDGFYMYTPSYNARTKRYEHDLKNYVYYSETLEDGTVIRYSLDNYVSVTVKKTDGTYEVNEGYLVVPGDLWIDGSGNTKYKGIDIVEENIDGVSDDTAKRYYKDAKEFTYWFINEADINFTVNSYLKINSSNDPEDVNSAFSQHKRKVIKDKIESVLNSTITAYSERTWGRNYKMPKLSAEEWERVYSNISMIAFFQGKRIGLTKYNGYCVLNSTNSHEYVNPEQMYFIEDDGDDTTQDYYHDIRCNKISSSNTLTGYKIGAYSKRKVKYTVDETDPVTGDVIKVPKEKYQYDHGELACYSCVNGHDNSNDNFKMSVQEYIAHPSTAYELKQAYWTSLARERYNITKITKVDKKDYVTVTFDSQGGDVISSQKIVKGEKATEPTAPNKLGQIFGGWYKDALCTDAYAFTTPVTSDLILYAKWTGAVYTIKFDPVGGTPAPADQSKAYDEYVDKPTDPGKLGYTFGGWYKDSSYINPHNFATDKVTGDLTLYASWSEDIYTIKFDAKGGTPVPADQNKKYNEYVDEPEVPSKPGGYTFGGWYKDSACTIPHHFATDKVTGDLTLYAKWNTLSYTVAFNSQGGSSVSSQTVNHGGKATTPTAPTKPGGYTFGGWYKEAACTNEYDFNTSVTSNITLYAKWNTLSYTVTFNSQGGSSVSSQTVNHGGKATTPTAPTRAMYTFEGWYKEAACTNAYDFNTSVTSNITLYAKWTISPPQITAVYYSNKTIYANIQSATTISTVELERRGTFTYNKEMESGTYVVDGNQYNYKYKFTLNPSGDAYTITVTDILGNTNTVSGNIP